MEVKPKQPEAQSLPAAQEYSSAGNGIQIEISGQNVTLVIDSTMAEYIGTYRRCKAVKVEFKKGSYPVIKPI